MLRRDGAWHLTRSATVLRRARVGASPRASDKGWPRPAGGAFTAQTWQRLLASWCSTGATTPPAPSIYTVCVCVCVCVYACVRACVRAGVRACARACLWVPLACARARTQAGTRSVDVFELAWNRAGIASSNRMKIRVATLIARDLNRAGRADVHPSIAERKAERAAVGCRIRR